MIGVNVLPESYVHSYRRRSRVRGWLMIVMAAGCAAAGPVGLDAWRTAQASASQREAEPMRIRLSQTQQRLSESAARVAELRQQLSRADALRSKRPWKNLLVALTERVPDEIWLTSLESVNQSPNVSRNGNSAANKDSSVQLAGPSGLRLVGFALEYDHLYAFMGVLDDGKLFSRVDLVKSSQQPVLEGRAVRFELECAW